MSFYSIHDNLPANPTSTLGSASPVCSNVVTVTSNVICCILRTYAQGLYHIYSKGAYVYSICRFKTICARYVVFGTKYQRKRSP